ncbi:hypothetical protein HY407_03805 [Candidatus Gottesmanbacteria bacterium]|nr:hypothetical protein [Candidatus Gottesmanbacteria bacterium]
MSILTLLALVIAAAILVAAFRGGIREEHASELRSEPRYTLLNRELVVEMVLAFPVGLFIGINMRYGILGTIFAAGLMSGLILLAFNAGYAYAYDRWLTKQKKTYRK